MSSQKVPNIVIATCRPESLKRFLDKWNKFLQGCIVHVVFDLDEIPEEFTKPPYSYKMNCYSHKEIEEDLKDKAWIIPYKSSACKSYGFYKAWQNNPLFIYALDDDVMPPIDGSDPIKIMYEKLYHTVLDSDERWLSTTKDFLPRGTPKGVREIMVVHGMWENIPDYSAEKQALTQEKGPTFKSKYNDFVVPKDVIISMCGMNLAFKPQVANLMYFGLQGHIKINGELVKMPTRRTDDILAGIYVKKKLDELGYAMYSGEPYCWHSRASTVWTNLADEENDEEIIKMWEAHVWDHEDFYCFEEYFNKLLEAYHLWGELFAKNTNSS